MTKLPTLNGQCSMLNGQLPMTFDAYLFSISRATEADALHALDTEAANDPELDQQEKNDLSAAVNRRFAWLNARASRATPRWNSGLRTED